MRPFRLTNCTCVANPCVLAPPHHDCVMQTGIVGRRLLKSGAPFAEHLCGLGGRVCGRFATSKLKELSAAGSEAKILVGYCCRCKAEAMSYSSCYVHVVGVESLAKVFLLANQRVTQRYLRCLLLPDNEMQTGRTSRLTSLDIWKLSFGIF